MPALGLGELSSSAVGLREPSGAAKVPAPQGEPEVHVGSACHVKLEHELEAEKNRRELRIIDGTRGRVAKRETHLHVPQKGS